MVLSKDGAKLIDDLDGCVSGLAYTRPTKEKVDAYNAAIQALKTLITDLENDNKRLRKAEEINSRGDET
jgi:outer membrane murein-binding lipoprotein Lpp